MIVDLRATPVYVRAMGKAIRLQAVASSVAESNAFMEESPAASLLHAHEQTGEEGGASLYLLADINDKGIDCNHMEHMHT